jgi:hypothetical protein
MLLVTIPTNFRFSHSFLSLRHLVYCHPFFQTIVFPSQCFGIPVVEYDRRIRALAVFAAIRRLIVPAPTTQITEWFSYIFSSNSYNEFPQKLRNSECHPKDGSLTTIILIAIVVRMFDKQQYLG